MEETLFLISPNCSQSDIEILIQLRRKGFKINDKTSVLLSREQAVDFYMDLKGQMRESDYDEVIKSACNGPTVALLLQKVELFSELEQFVQQLITEKIEKENVDQALGSLDKYQGLMEGFYFSSEPQSVREIQFFFPNHSLRNLLTPEQANEYLQNSVYPILLNGLAALCRKKPENPAEWLGNWLMNNSISNPKVIEPDSSEPSE